MQRVLRASTPWTTVATSLTAAAATAYAFGQGQQGRRTMLSSYQAFLAVPMRCEACCEDIKSTLQQVADVQSIDCDLRTQSVVVQGSAAPSKLVNAIQGTGRSAILRGSGAPNSAAVCILETPIQENPGSSVRGLVRLIQLNGTLTMLDLTLTDLSPGRYSVAVTTSGNISDGLRTMGETFRGLAQDKDGVLGHIYLNERGRGSMSCEITWPVWEMIGRGMVLQKTDSTTERDGIAIGVIARSAGAWENDKVVCACSGKTIWQEREEMLRQGIS